MKRFHIHLGVKSIEDAVPFYSGLFNQGPSKVKGDYAKWMLEDPKINFAISTRTASQGVDHLGIQVDDEQELRQITERLKQTKLEVYDEGASTCCYAKSEKAWVKDPAGVAWETFRSMEDAEIFSSRTPTEESACCVPNEGPAAKCC